jgi:hypothetical protein
MKIEFYDLKSKVVEVNPSYRDISLNLEFEEFINKKWSINNAGHKSSLIPSCDNLSYASDRKAIISAGVTEYKKHFGIVSAIIEGKEFMKNQFTTTMGVAMYGVTSDNKIPLQKRGGSLTRLARGYYMPIATGWMTAMNLYGEDKCENRELVNDPKLYDIRIQAIEELKEESNLDNEDFELSKPFGIVRSDKVHGMAISSVVKVNKTGEYVKNLMENSDHEGRKEYDKILLLDARDLHVLLRNQVKLQKMKLDDNKSEDVKEQVLLPEIIGGFIGCYEQLTGEKIPDDLVDYLKDNGIDFEMMPSSSGTFYSFRDN